MLGCLIVLFRNKSSDKVITFSLAFSAGVMFYISIFDLFVSSINIISNYYSIVFSILLSMLFSYTGYLIIKLIDINYSGNDLYKTGFLSFIALVLHNIPEGILTFLLLSNDFRIGLSFTLSIILHNIPEGISIFTPLYYSGKKSLAFLYTFIGGFSEVIGSILAYLFLYRFMNDYFLSFLYSVTSGIMVYVCFVKLIKESLHYKNIFFSFLSFLMGIIIIYFSSIIIR